MKTKLYKIFDPKTEQVSQSLDELLKYYSNPHETGFCEALYHAYIHVIIGFIVLHYVVLYCSVLFIH